MKSLSLSEAIGLFTPFLVTMKLFGMPLSVS